MALKLNGTNSVAAPAYAGDDADTGLQCGTNELKLVTGGSARATVNSSGNVGIQTTSPGYPLEVAGQIETSGSNNAVLFDGASSTPTIGAGIHKPADDTLAFVTASSERARLDGSGRLLFGSTSARTNFNNGTASPQIQIENVANGNKSSIALIHNENALSDSSALNFAKTRGGSVGDNSALNQSGDRLGTITFQGNDGTEFVQAASIEGLTDATPGNNDMPGKLSFRTTGDGASSTTERMRINRNGVLFLGQFATTTPGYGNTTTGIAMQPDGRVFSSMGGTFSQFNRNSNGSVISFARSSTGVGQISVTTSSTSYGTSSDYRLKENVVALDGAIGRVKQLLPKRFNFIVDADTTVDGFLAHEAQTVVPEAVTGTHDEVDDDSNPVYQCIDQSKLVPVLTAALQEAIAKIETLETKVAALEAAS